MVTKEFEGCVGDEWILEKNGKRREAAKKLGKPGVGGVN